MSWTPPKGPKGPIKKARAKRERKWRRKLRRRKKGGVQKLRLINPPAHEAKARAKVGKSGWTRAELESAILSTAARRTDMRRFRWLAYGQRRKDESLVVTVWRTHYIDAVDRGAMMDIAFDLRDEGHLTYSNRWGWRVK